MATPSDGTIAVTGPRGRQLQELFERAVELDGPERNRFVENVRRDDPALATELEIFLDLDVGADDDAGFRPIVEPTGTGAGTSGAAGSDPEFVGGYRIIRRLGAGGMGVVYEAEQEQPKRRVALKVIRGGRLADDVQRQLFRREVDALARLDHPGIATIIEAGHAEDGLPFFVMELVRGRTLEEHFLEDPAPALSAASLRRRLLLFLRLCEAVHYAHQRGVVHRDLKPSNILVTDATGGTGSGSSVGVPHIKILDFGVARVLSAGGDDSVALTRAGDVRGTLQYMSPEQAAGDPAAVDTRSDVYALGVLLYRLLTGGVPYDLDGQPLPAALRVICEEPPRPPSRTVAPRAFPADLEAILLQALAKSADRRYQSAHALREDVERFLDRQPVQARRSSSLYELRMMFARHRVPFSLGVLLLAVLAGFAVAMTIAAERTARARDAATRERDRANLEAETAQSVSDFLVDLFRQADPEQAAGPGITAEEIAARGAERIRQELTDQPRVRARLLETLGRVQMNLGHHDEARTLFREALDVHAESGSADTLMAKAWNDLARLHHRAGEFEAAFEAYELAVTLCERGGHDPHAELARALNGIGNAHSRAGRFDEAERVYSRALQIRRAVFGPEDESVANVFGNLGLLESRRGNFAAAVRHLSETLRIQEAVLGEDHPRLVTTLVNVAGPRYEVGDFETGVADLERALAIVEESFGPDHPARADVLATLARFHQARGDLAAATETGERAVEIQEAAMGPEHPTLVPVLDNLARVRLDAGDAAGGLQLHTRALGIARKVYGHEHATVAAALAGVAQAAFAAGDAAAAERDYREALRIQENALGDEHPSVGATLTSLGVVLRERGELDGARRALERGGRTMAAARGLHHADVVVNFREQVEVLARLGDSTAARALSARIDSIEAAGTD